MEEIVTVSIHTTVDLRVKPHSVKKLRMRFHNGVEVQAQLLEDVRPQYTLFKVGWLLDDALYESVHP